MFGKGSEKPQILEDMQKIPNRIRKVTKVLKNQRKSRYMQYRNASKNILKTQKSPQCKTNCHKNNLKWPKKFRKNSKKIPKNPGISQKTTQKSFKKKTRKVMKICEKIPKHLRGTRKSRKTSERSEKFPKTFESHE